MGIKSEQNNSSLIDNTAQDAQTWGIASLLDAPAANTDDDNDLRGLPPPASSSQEIAPFLAPAPPRDEHEETAAIETLVVDAEASPMVGPPVERPLVSTSVR